MIRTQWVWSPYHPEYEPNGDYLGIPSKNYTVRPRLLISLPRAKNSTVDVTAGETVENVDFVLVQRTDELRLNYSVSEPEETTPLRATIGDSTSRSPGGCSRG